MFGKLIFGVYINISIWFKLKDKTLYGLAFTIIGAIFAILGNFILLPVIGILGSAISIIISYLAMTLTCYFVGKKFFPVPYRFLPILAYSAFFMAIVVASFYIQFDNTLLDVAFNLSIPAIMLVLVYLIERKNILRTVDN
jgi:O-antigen/teichoic acid export membrane protein